VDLVKGSRHRVTYDEGVAEGAVLSPDGKVLYSATTRAREPAFLTMVSGPGVPAFLGCVAEPTLHEQLATRHLAMIGNGDVIAVDPTYGLHARIVGSRRPLAKRADAATPGGSFRLVACSMSRDGRDLAVAMNAPTGSDIVLIRRRRSSIPPAIGFQPTPTPPGTAPLSNTPLVEVNRVMESRRGGRVTVQFSGDLNEGEFRVVFDNFSADGVFVWGGQESFETRSEGGFRHVADIRRITLESQEDVNVFYRADMQVEWPEQGLTDVQPQLVTGGSISSLSRSGDCAAGWDGATFAPQDGWNAGNRGPRPVPGSKRCHTTVRGAAAGWSAGR